MHRAPGIRPRSYRGWASGCLLLACLAGCGDGQRVLELRWQDGGLKERRTVVPDANGQWLNHGPFTTYYMDGQTKAEEGAYDKGRLHGKVTHWYENGQKKDEVIWNQGRVSGEALFWNEQGQQISAPPAAAGPPVQP